MLEELVREFDGFILLADKCVEFFSAHWAWESVPFFHTSVVHGLGCCTETRDGNIVFLSNEGGVFRV